MDVCVIGQGYIGIPTAILFAYKGCNVTGVDINEKIVSNLNNGILPIEEPKLNDYFIECLNNKHYHASLTPVEADVYIITVPTPFKKDDLTCDLSYVISACESILPFVKRDDVIIVESTIAPLSMKNFVKPIFERNGFSIGDDLFLSHCPERVLPGNMVHELVHNNRIIGGVTEECAKKAADVYRIFVKGEIIETKAEVAELSKCMENTFRDVNIALANELVKIGVKLDIDALEVIRIANQHPRVNIHSPGPGVGGHCLAIDPYFIYSLVPDVANIIKLSRDTNNSMPDFVVDTVKKIIGNSDTKEIISIFGLSYKGNSDDDRESPSYKIINKLENNYEIKIYEPHIKEKSLTIDEALTDSSLILILTDHNEFKELNFDKIVSLMKKPVLFDTKNVINKEKIPKSVTYYNFGNIGSMFSNF